MVPGCALALAIEMSLTHSAPFSRRFSFSGVGGHIIRGHEGKEEPLYCAQYAVSMLTERSSRVAQDEFWRRMRFWKF